MNALNGCLLINKRKDVTSRYEVNTISHILKEKKCGHIGTLDPFATGLLIVLVGRATKISPFLEREEKSYIASLKLGEKTDSGDLTGEVIETKDVPLLSEEEIKKIFTNFLGDKEQIPPMYSALKKDGKHLYDYARKGIEIERSSRPIHIYELNLLSYKDNIITFSTRVSKGTYIRTLGEDIALKLGSIGHLISLERTSIGEFSLNDAIEAEDVKPESLISIDRMLEKMERINLNEKDAFKALNGVSLNLQSESSEVLVADQNGIIAVYQKKGDTYICLRGLR